MKICTRCDVSKDFELFPKRAASRDGYAAACKACVNRDKFSTYWLDEAQRRAALQRVKINRTRYYATIPGYRRAHNLWNDANRRSRVPPWVKLVDFLPICVVADRKGPKYVVDHVIPFNHPLVCGLHVPSNLQVISHRANLTKGNTWMPE